MMDQSPDQIDNRRRFWLKSLAGLGVFSSLLFSFGIFRYLSFSDSGGRPERIIIGPLDSASLKAPRSIQGLWLLRDPKGLYALENLCPHLGCQFLWDPEMDIFRCPCHGSRFAKTGEVLKGPTGKPLRPVFLSRSPTGELIAHPNRTADPDFRLPL